MSATQATVTHLLVSLQEGDRSVYDTLFPMVYEVLHAQAQRQRRKWQGDYTLNTTALVHEAYLKLVDQTQANFTSRAHFLAVASKAMRHILVDYARYRKTQKRGGDVAKHALHEVPHRPGLLEPIVEPRTDELLALEQALERLAHVDAREAKVVECLYFGGMTVKETATALDIGERTVKRDWAMARAWLYRAMQDET